MPQLGITAHRNMLADDRRVAAGNDIDTPVMRKECRATPPVDVASAALSANACSHDHGLVERSPWSTDAMSSP
ncbi:unannotated protein [freshwater metagenome]|uniref:Unannotated protein n=1 Tax=freshwater metagenome TaxID=449393 RepID=A0A6J7GZL3_9ZZZZ